METTQLAQMVNWLDEQHRRDRAEIAKLQQRVESQTNEIQEQARRVKELEARVTSTQTQLGRFTQIEQALQNLKNEVTILVNNQSEETARAMREQERARLSDREGTSRALAEIRKELPRFRPIEEELAVRKAEDRRLSEIVIDLRQETANLHKELENRTGTIPYLAEQRTHDNKRIVQVQQENVELFKRAEEAGSKLQMLEQKQQKMEGTVQSLPPVVDNLKRAQEQFIDSLKLADADRQRQMREWNEIIAGNEAQMIAHRERIQEFAASYEESKRSLAALEKFQERLQRDQSQVAELQRLSEERLKKEMANFATENEKRWKKQILEWQYRWDQQDKTNARVADRFPSIIAQLGLHDELLQFLWRYVESQGSAQLSASQRWLADIQKLAGQREKILKEHEEAKLQPGMKVIATAGHVDHGKSTLVRALTGIDPDRLSEEKERGMTIDLGFAWLDLPNGEAVGIVDVPGHIDFIKNMLAGVGGIDAALFVIAADEGVMPQTQEHLAILDLLEIPRGVVALTKADLVDDPEWLELVQEEVRDLLAPTSLKSAAIVPVAAQTGAGLDQLLAALSETLAQSPARPDLGRPRLPIDRVFSISGFGTVVTGTLVDGSLRVGDEVMLMPGDVRSRIRGLQTHKSKLEIARPGSRVAVNLTGVHPDDIQRGQVLTVSGVLRGSMRVDVRLRALASAPAALRHNMEITFHHAAAEAMGRLRLLEADELTPGSEAWAQIELRDPIALVRGDRFIIRRPSPSATLGGGIVVDPAPRRRHRRRRPELFAHFQTLLKGDAADLLESAIDLQGPLPAAQALQAVDLSKQQAESALNALLENGRVQRLDADDPAALLITPSSWRRISQALLELLAAFHQNNPLRLGMAREEVKSRLQPKSGWTAKVFNAIIARAQDEGLLRDTGAYLAMPDFAVLFTPAQERTIAALLTQYRAEPYTPPSVKQSLEVVDEAVFNALVEQGTLVRVAADVAFERQTYEAMVAAIRDYIQTHGQITVADLRDLFGASRKYTLALLEYLDQIRVTRREGDARVLR